MKDSLVFLVLIKMTQWAAFSESKPFSLRDFKVWMAKYQKTWTLFLTFTDIFSIFLNRWSFGILLYEMVTLGEC